MPIVETIIDGAYTFQETMQDGDLCGSMYSGDLVIHYTVINALELNNSPEVGPIDLMTGIREGLKGMTADMNGATVKIGIEINRDTIH